MPRKVKPKRKPATRKPRNKATKKKTPAPRKAVTQSQRVHVTVRNSIGEQAAAEPPPPPPFMKSYSTYPVMEAIPQPRPYEPALQPPMGLGSGISDKTPIMRSNPVADLRDESIMDRYLGALEGATPTSYALQPSDTSVMGETSSVDIRAMSKEQLKQFMVARGFEVRARDTKEMMIWRYMEAPK